LNVAFKTLGCKLNYSETSSISRDFENKGHKKVSFKDNADLYVINTCSVTHNADKEFKYLVNKAKKINPKSKIIAIGCYAQLKPLEISEIEGVDLVLGADKKFDLINYINTNESHSCEIDNVSTFKSAYSMGDRTRSFLKAHIVQFH
jgi:threonylcarbamoyladenosine tRNA methylthiotransferase MtaB